MAGLQRGPFEPLDSVELKFLSAKTALLTALTSIKRVGDHQAFSVSEECLVFGTDYSHIGSHHALPWSVSEAESTALWGDKPSLGVAVSHKSAAHIRGPHQSFRSSEQLFVSHGGQQKGKAVFKQRLAHWIVDAISMAYQSQGELCPPGVRVHSAWSVASPYALAHGTSLVDICWAVGWETPNTYARFYSLHVEPVSSRVLCNRYVVGRTGQRHACCAFPPHPEMRVPFSSSSNFPGRRTLVKFLQHPRQSDWAEQSDTRPSTGVSLPGSPVSPCTGLGALMAWLPSGNPMCVFFHGKVSLSGKPCLPFDRALCQALLTALLSTTRLGLPQRPMYM